MQFNYSKKNFIVLIPGPDPDTTTFTLLIDANLTYLG